MPTFAKIFLAIFLDSSISFCADKIVVFISLNNDVTLASLHPYVDCKFKGVKQVQRIEALEPSHIGMCASCCKR